MWLISKFKWSFAGQYCSAVLIFLIVQNTLENIGLDCNIVTIYDEKLSNISIFLTIGGHFENKTKRISKRFQIGLYHISKGTSQAHLCAKFGTFHQIQGFLLKKIRRIVAFSWIVPAISKSGHIGKISNGFWGRFLSHFKRYISS